MALERPPPDYRDMKWANSWNAIGIAVGEYCLSTERRFQKSAKRTEKGSKQSACFPVSSIFRRFNIACDM